MRYQIALFFTALQFYTRFPAPEWVEYKPKNLSMATRFLPLMGWIVGFIAALSFLVFSFITNISIGILMSMVASILVTGAFHEDGFADVCDGFGGGWTKEKILLIMKDSRIGTYGSVGLILILALKFSLLQDLATKIESDPLVLTLLFIAAHSVSRFMPAIIIFTQPYARDSDDSKSKPVAQKVNAGTLIIAGIFAIIPMILLSFLLKELLLFGSLVFLGLITFVLNRYFRKWIGGYTGDCLGAIQQVCEIGFYLFLVVLWKFT